MYWNPNSEALATLFHILKYNLPTAMFLETQNLSSINNMGLDTTLYSIT